MVLDYLLRYFSCLLHSNYKFYLSVYVLEHVKWNRVYGMEERMDGSW
jgi:hypothetical protein